MAAVRVERVIASRSKVFAADSGQGRVDVSRFVWNEVLATTPSTAGRRTDDYVFPSGDPRDTGFAAIRTSV